jgi:cytochrome P450
MKAPALFNPLLPEYRDDPYPFLHRLREQEPVHWSQLIGVWVLTRYADVSTALRDERFSASAKNWSQYERFFLRREIDRNSPLTQLYGNWMLQVDPPHHTRLRALVSKAFTPRRVESMRERIRAIVNEALDGLASPGHLDVVSDLAYPLPVIVISDMLGVPREDHGKIKDWTAKLLPSLGPALSIAALRQVNDALSDFREYIRGLCELRRASPRDDMLSALIAAQEQGDRLNDNELFATFILLALAGHASSVQALSNTILSLIRNPDQLALLRSRPDYMAAAVEESLRYESPLQILYRTTLEPVRIGGTTIGPNQMVFLSMPAANRDPDRFPDPDRFDICRQDNRHLSFGYGVHYCAGAALGRLEIQIAIEVILQRMANLRLADQPLQRESSLLLRGLTSLPVDFDPLPFSKAGEAL